MKNFDSNLILKYLDKEFFNSVRIVPKTNEKYLSFSLRTYNNHYVKFLDSYQFLPSSLEKLTENLKIDGIDSFRITKYLFESEYGRIDDEIFDKLISKSAYPYEFMDSFQKFNQNFPEEKNFYSSLNFSDVDHEKYLIAKKIYSEFNCQNMGDFHDLYVLLDTCLLCDIFTKFRKNSMKLYDLEPCHYFSLPSYSFDAMLKLTEVKIELLTDLDMYLFIEKSLRGGVSQVSCRFSQANNKYMGDNFDNNEKSKFITYFDANNLYGWASSQSLPYGNFEWVESNEFSSIDWKILGKNDDKGYILECDLEYPEYLHELHKDYPLAPIKRKIKYSELSEYQLHLVEDLKRKNLIYRPTKKLILDLYDKKNYVLHYLNLKLYLELGMKLKKVNKVLRFSQSKWLASYINFNTRLREKATDKFTQDQLKLQNNSVFGKTCENTRNHVEVKFVIDEKQAKNFLKRPLFNSFEIIDEEKVIIRMNKTKLNLNKPLFIGFSILELSKKLMYNFHYNIFEKFFHGRFKLLYTGLFMIEMYNLLIIIS